MFKLFIRKFTKMIRKILLLLLLVSFSLQKIRIVDSMDFIPRVKFDAEEIKFRLTENAFDVTQKALLSDFYTGGFYEMYKRRGSYKCVVCYNNLFESKDKYFSSGYAAFNEATDEGIGVVLFPENIHGYVLYHARCGNCGAYLGRAYENIMEDDKYKFMIQCASLSFYPSPDIPLRNQIN